MPTFQRLQWAVSKRVKRERFWMMGRFPGNIQLYTNSCTLTQRYIQSYNNSLVLNTYKDISLSVYTTINFPTPFNGRSPPIVQQNTQTPQMSNISNHFINPKIQLNIFFPRCFYTVYGSLCHFLSL